MPREIVYVDSERAEKTHDRDGRGKRRWGVGKIVRITRHPLATEDIERLRAEGRLPDDYADRSATATDFVKVDDDADDATAREQALAKTRLTIRGECVEFHEVNGPDARELK